jgi:hypothetical protein
VTTHYPRFVGAHSLDRATEPVRAFHALWDARRAGRLAPARGDFSDADLARWIWGLTEVEVVSFPDELVYRAMSPRNAYMRGMTPDEIVGRSVRDAHFGRAYDEILGNYRAALAGDVVIDADPHVGVSGYYRESEVLFLPLSSDGVRVDRIFVYCEHEPVF